MTERRAINIEVQRQIHVGVTADGNIVMLGEDDSLLACREYECDEHLGADLRKYLTEPLKAERPVAKLKRPRRTDNDLSALILEREWFSVEAFCREHGIRKKRLEPLVAKLELNGFLRKNIGDLDTYYKTQTEIQS